VIGPSSLARIRSFARQEKAQAAERCELCGLALSERHPHLIAPATGRIACSCGTCSLLFPVGTGSRFRRIPDRVKRVPELSTRGDLWAGLGIPVTLAFVFVRSESGQIVAIYPSPAGPTPASVDPEAWKITVEACPALSDLETDVEALLLHGLQGDREAFVVPIDLGYQLIGRLKKSWQGFSGGEKVREDLRDFFTRLRAREEGATRA
jgi:hypothetical protein